MRQQGQFCTTQVESVLLHLFSTYLISCPNQLITLFVPLHRVGFPHCGVLPHSLFYSCSKSYKPIDQPKQQQNRRIMLIKLHYKALNQVIFSINSSISFDFILREEQHLQPGDVNSFVPFLMKRDTPTSCSSLGSLPRAKIYMGEKNTEKIRSVFLTPGQVSIPCS